ncbi:MAG TPA: SDR family oxidoreductase [Anaeromyxobacter sp.]|nr:SDR family oxidoreductase [Anaeromyxobacter sp.]
MNGDERFALVTGASGGIGLEIARELARRGHPLVLAARSEGKLAALAAELGRAHRVRAETVPVDLATPDGPARLVAAMEGKRISPEILVNNAGVGMHGPFAEADAAALAAMLQLDVTSLALLTRSLLPGMRARGRGRILNLASTAAFVPGPFMAGYFASKAFVLSLSVALADELRGTGVTVTALCPGATESEFASRAGNAGSRLFRRGVVMDARSVARAGVEGMLAGKRIVVPGLANRLIAGSSGLAPRAVTARIARFLNEPARPS